MVTSNTSPLEDMTDDVDRRTMELIAEFEQHYHDAVKMKERLQIESAEVFNRATNALTS